MTRAIRPVHVFGLLAIFWMMWFYTEWTEFNERESFKHRVDTFISNGDRFTAEDGKKLEARIKALEADDNE